MVPYRKHTEGGEFFSGINIVPFTDVVLVLLVIFMIAAPGLLSSGLNIDLPGASTSDPEIPSKITVGLDRTGRVYLDGEPVEAEALADRIQSLVNRREDIGVVLNADREAGYGKVIEVLDAVRRGGARRIYVGTVQQ